MPIQYNSILAEAKAVRSSAGIFDISHMGRIEISGKNSSSLINNVVTFDVMTIANNQAKYGLIDYNIHPPTMYFPLIVEEALMIEPTESETKETLDYFVDVVKEIVSDAKNNPDIIRSAPHTAANRRLDEAKAARNPDLKFTTKQ